MLRFPQLWTEACAEYPPHPNGAAGELMTAVSELLDVDQVEYSQEGQAALFLFDLSSLGFKGMDLNLVMIAHPPADDDEALRQAQVLSQYKYAVGAFGYCLDIVLSPDVTGKNKFIPAHVDPIFLCGADLERLFLSKAPRLVLLEIIRRQVPIQALCPFSTTREARGPMFKGRRDELLRLTTELRVDFAVTGARRIGKTSLIHRAYDTLRIQPQHRDRVFLFNCLTWGDAWDCFHRLAHSIDPKKELRIEEGLRNVSYLLERKSHKGTKPLLLFFDEVDRLIERDAKQGWLFFRVLREAQTEGWVRVVFAGYRSTKTLSGESRERAMTDSSREDSPFYRSLETLSLEPLPQQETRALIEEPFQNLEITVRDGSQIWAQIWQETRGYPFLIQFYGEQIYWHASGRTPQEALPQDVEAVSVGYPMREFMLNYFLDNTLEHGQPVLGERLCALFLAHEITSELWQEADFLNACENAGVHQGIDEIHRSLRSLVQADVFEYIPGGYKFVFPLMREILRETYPARGAVLESLGIREPRNG